MTHNNNNIRKLIPGPLAITTNYNNNSGYTAIEKPKPKGLNYIDFWQIGEIYYTTKQVFGDKTDLIAKRNAANEAMLKEIEEDFNAVHGSAGNTIKIHKGMQVGASTNLLNNAQTYIDTWVYLNPGALLTCLENDKEEMIVKFLVLDPNGGYHDNNNNTKSIDPFYMWYDYSNGIGGMFGYFTMSSPTFDVRNGIIPKEEAFELYNSEESIEAREQICELFRKQKEEEMQMLWNWTPKPTPQFNHIVSPVNNTTTTTINITHEVKPEHFTYCDSKTESFKFDGYICPDIGVLNKPEWTAEDDAKYNEYKTSIVSNNSNKK